MSFTDHTPVSPPRQGSPDALSAPATTTRPDDTSDGPSRGRPMPDLSPRNAAKARALGVPSATGLVIGSIVGTGVFTMPAVLAQAGTMSLVVLGVIAIGAMVLGGLFGQLTKRVPNSDGGLYAYARHEFGDFAGYMTGWCYWVQAWAGNAAIVSSWVFYVDALFNWHASGIENWGIALVGLWVPAVVNLVGIRQVAWFQNVSVVLKFVPLLFIGVVGWFFVKSANFGGFNMSGGSLYSGIGIAAGVALFSFIGVEAAAITAKRVKDPGRNVGRASLLGTGLSAILYLLTAAVVMGLVAHHTLVGTGSPFVNAFQTMFVHETWAGKFIAAVAVVSGIGALNGWTLLVTETSRAIAQDDMFPRPFAWEDRNHTAWFGIVVGAALPSILMLWSYETKAGLTVFTYLVDLTVVTVAIPYFMSALAQLTFLVSKRRRVQGWALARDLLVAIIAVLFSMWVTFASGYQVVYQALVVIMAGLVLYAFLNARRQRLGEAVNPLDNPVGTDRALGEMAGDGQPLGVAAPVATVLDPVLATSGAPSGALSTGGAGVVGTTTGAKALGGVPVGGVPVGGVPVGLGNLMVMPRRSRTPGG